MDIKFLLDFDGVLFNSAFEAYTVANHSIAGLPDYRQDITFEEFAEFRAFVTDAWQYNRLYSAHNALPSPDYLPAVTPEDEDWRFSERFFAARATIMKDSEWPKVMSPYDFFFLLKPLLIAHPEKFTILSTRNVESIRQTLAFFGADVVAVFGQEDIRKHGSKIRVAESQGWLERGRYLVIYVDDMNSHLEPFEGKVHLPLHAGWGYDRADVGSLTEHQIFTIIGSMLKISEQTSGTEV